MTPRNTMGKWLVLCALPVLFLCLAGCDDEPKKGSATKTALGYEVAIDGTKPSVKTGNLMNRTRGDIEYTYCTAVVAPASGSGTVDLADYLTEASQEHLDKLAWFVNGNLNAEGAILAYSSVDADLEVIERLVDVRDETTGLQFDQIAVVIVSNATKDAYDEWYDDEKDNMGWTANLPAVYSSLTLDGTTPQDPEPADSQRWQNPSGLNSHYHPGASYEMRSEIVNPGGHGHQACYGVSGVILTDGVAAGTADRSHWSNMVGATSHAELDVLPFIRACQLDGNAVTGTWLNRNLTRPIMHSETYVGKYLEVRPVLAEPSRQIAPGTPCP